MLSKRGICLFLLVTGTLMLATSLGLCERENLDRTRADGGAPPPPPIPWATGLGEVTLDADGGAPPPPPIPWPPNNTSEGSTLKADGGAPPPPPIPWGFVSVGNGSLTV
jgi:hypothetical protein